MKGAFASSSYFNLLVPSFIYLFVNHGELLYSDKGKI